VYMHVLKSIVLIGQLKL